MPLAALLTIILASACAPQKPPSPEAEGPVFYPPLPQTPRLQFLATYTSEEDVIHRAGGFEEFILGETKYRELGKVYGVALDQGEMLICDTKAGAVIIFDIANGAVRFLGTKAPGKLIKPVNVTVDPEDGRRYVVDTGLKRIVVFDRSGAYLRAIGEPETWKPSDVAVFGKRLYATDLQNGQIVVFDKRTGNELERISQRGDGPADLFFPTNIAVDADGNIYVSDTGNFRIQKFSPDGTHLMQFGSLGRSLGQFARPKGVAVDREGRVYVVDAAFENVQIFAPDGTLLLFFGEPGAHPGAMNMPAKVIVDYDDVDLFADRVAPGYAVDHLVIVTSQFGVNKVNVYAFLKPPAGKESAASGTVEQIQ